jgi:hypothetical protein
VVRVTAHRQLCCRTGERFEKQALTLVRVPGYKTRGYRRNAALPDGHKTGSDALLDWRGRMGVEPTGAGVTDAHAVLKTGEATGPLPPPSTSFRDSIPTPMGAAIAPGVVVR